MPAAIDIGNSTIVVKFFSELNGDKSKQPESIRFNTGEISAAELLSTLEECGIIIVSSVVKSYTEEIKLLKPSLKQKIFFIELPQVKAIDFSRYLSALGTDRIAGVLGALTLTHPPFAVIDMGTAITVSLVDRNSSYAGGFITAGVETQLKSLKHFTSQLPLLKLDKIPESFLGIDTENSILNGAYYFTLNALNGIRQTLYHSHPELKVIGTGGFSIFFKECFDITDSELIFKGMEFYYNNYCIDRQRP